MKLNFTKSKFLAINSELTEIIVNDNNIQHTISRIGNDEFLRLLGFFFNAELSPNKQWETAINKAETKLSLISKSNINLETGEQA